MIDWLKIYLFSMAGFILFSTLFGYDWFYSAIGLTVGAIIMFLIDRRRN